jgi:XapX domain-containing protein
MLQAGAHYTEPINLQGAAPMNYLISLAIGLFVGVIYGALDFRSPAPPAIALVGLMGMLLGEKLWPMGREWVSGWFF